MMRKMGEIRSMGFGVITVFLVMVLAFCWTGIVKSRTDLSVQELEGYYHEKEQALVEEARDLLRDRGFANSGVMLTRVVDESGRRQYTLTVHHGRISRMGEEDRQKLLEELEGIVFEDENSSFYCKFFENQ